MTARLERAVKIGVARGRPGEERSGPARDGTRQPEWLRDPLDVTAAVDVQ